MQEPEQSAAADDATNELEDYHTVDLELPTAEVTRSTDAQRLAESDTPPSSHSGEPKRPMDPFAIGAIVRQRYCIEGVIGSGGSAIIYQARDLHWEVADGGCAQVAIKTLRPELRRRVQSIARLKREFRQTRLLTHPSIVRVFDLDCHDDAWFIVMELLDGVSLSTQLRATPLLPPERIRNILASCSAALQFAHERGVVHGDLKPGNVFLLDSGEARLLDFGASPESTAQSSDANGVCAIPPAVTPAYASPEVLASQPPEVRDDVFSLACIAQQMLTGRHPAADKMPTQEIGVDDSPIAGVERLQLSEQQMVLLNSARAPSRAKRPASVAALLEFMKPVEVPAPAAPVVTPPVATEPTPEPEIIPSAPAAQELHVENIEPSPEIEVPAAKTNSIDAIEIVETEIVQTTLGDSAALALLEESQEYSAVAMEDEAPISGLFDASEIDAFKQIDMQPGKVPLFRRKRMFRGLFAPAASRWAAAGVIALLGALAMASIREIRETRPVLQTPAPETTQTAENHEAGGETPAVAAPNAAAPPQAGAAAPADAKPAAHKPVADVVKAVTPPTQAVSFDVDTLAVSARASAAVVTLKRVNGRDGRVRITWRVKEGTARAGKDFSGPISGVLELAHWQTVKSLYIPLIAAPGDVAARKFTIKLTGASGARITPNDSVTVTIKDFG